MNTKTKSILGILIIIILFVLFSYFVQTNLGFFEDLIGEGVSGMLIYVLIKIIAIVVAPVSTLPLVSVASNLWGGFIAGVLNIIGWTIGAMIAFMLARKYGVDLIKKFVPIKKINKLEGRIPEENIFWSVVFLRMVIPVDILSYALGLFSKMKARDYLLATIIGIIPFAFILAYIGALPFYYQLIVLLIAGIILLVGLIIKRKREK